MAGNVALALGMLLIGAIYWLRPTAARSLRVPVSLGLLLLTAALYLVQVVPYTGIILMIFGAPLWPIVLVNLAMVGTAAEAGSGRCSRLWLILPVAYFGVYFAATTAQHAHYAALNAEITAANNAVRLKYDPARQALIVADPADANRLIDNYAIPVVYTPFSGAPGGFLAHRLTSSAVCDAMPRSSLVLWAGASAYPVIDPDAAFGGIAPRFCNISLPEVPPPGALLTTRRTNTDERWSPPALITQISLPMPDGGTATLRAGTAAVLHWVPMPFAGCILNSGAPSWDCNVGFMREALPLGGRREVAALLAQALGLHAVAAADRVAAPADALLVRVRALPDQILAAATAALDRVLSGAEQGAELEASLKLVSVLRNYPDVVAARLPAMVRAIENADFHPYGAASADARFSFLIDNLPAPQLVPYIRQRVVAALATPNGDSPDLSLAPLWVGAMAYMHRNDDDMSLFWRIVADPRIGGTADFIKRLYGNEAPVSARKILVDWVLDPRTSPKDRRYFSYLLAAMPPGTFADMTADEHRIIDDSARHHETIVFVQRLADTGQGLDAMMNILRHAVDDPDDLHRRALVTVVRRSLARMGPGAASALPEVLMLFNKTPSPLTSLNGTNNNPGQEHIWRVAMARMGLPIDQLPYRSTLPHEAQERDRRDVAREVARFNGDRAK